MSNKTKKFKGTGWQDEICSIIAGYKEGSNEPLDGDAVDDLRHRHRSSTHAAAEDGKANVKDQLRPASTHDNTHQREERATGDNPARDRSGVAEAGLNEHFGMNPKDGAGDQTADEKVEKVGARFLHETTERPHH